MERIELRRARTSPKYFGERIVGRGIEATMVVQRFERVRLGLKGRLSWDYNLPNPHIW